MQNKILATLLQRIRGFASQEKNYDFLLAQSVPLSLAFVAWLHGIIVPLVPGGFILTDVLLWILEKASFTAFILYLALVVFFVYHGIFVGHSSRRNISWFISGPGRSIRRLTALELVQYLDLDVLLASLRRFTSQPDRAFPMEVTRRMFRRIRSDKEAEPLISSLERILKEVFRTTDNPETWYAAGVMLKKRYNEFVEQIARQEVQQPGSKFRSKAVILLEPPEEPAFIRLPKLTLIYLSIAILALALVYYLAISGPRKIVWTSHLGKSRPNTLWVEGTTGLYRVTLKDENLGPSADFVLEDKDIKAMTCSPTEDMCFVATPGRRIGIVTKDSVEWLGLSVPDLTSEIETIWIAQNDGGSLHFWIQAGSRLFVSTDMNITWDEPFDNLAITQLLPVDERRAMLIAAQMESQPAQSIAYETTDSGKTWEKTQTGLADYTWLGAKLQQADHIGNLRSPDPSVQEMTYYVLSMSSQPMVLLASTANDQLWYSPQGLVWQKVFVPEESLGQRACGAWFSPPTVEVNGETTLLYRSYALLDGEQGIYLSWDRGLTWERISINGPTTVLSTVFHWHPSCGDAWQQIPDKLSSWLRSGSADGH